MELKCTTQHYDWGKLGSRSTVAQLVCSACSNTEIDENKPYAELWMGTHPNGPSIVVERDVSLAEYLKDNVDAVGPDVRKHFGVCVPFLFKVLSIRKALSIQAHPNKEHAASLHRDNPELYRDPNHKPELAIALTPFEALCGFRPAAQIINFIRDIPELKSCLSEDVAVQVESEGADVAKIAFTALMNCDSAVISENIDKLIDRLKNADAETQEAQLFSLFARLASDFPGDVGCFAVYLLNYMTLRPGQAIFLAPNLPHAYLSGDCVECMACSDNVVRAGLTPKHLDRRTLLAMLDYGPRALADLLFTPHLEDEFTCVWRPPVRDFAVAMIRLPAGTTYNTRNRPSPSIVLVAGGRGAASDTERLPLRAGSALFLKASRQLTLRADADLTLYQAFANV